MGNHHEKSVKSKTCERNYLCKNSFPLITKHKTNKQKIQSVLTNVIFQVCLKKKNMGGDAPPNGFPGKNLQGFVEDAQFRFNPATEPQFQTWSDMGPL